MSTRRKSTEAYTAEAWEKMLALPEDSWRGMVVKHRVREAARIACMEERRSRRDLPRMLKAEKKIEALEAVVSSQASQIADLQAMLGNALAALSPLATPQVYPPMTELPSSTSAELGAMLEQFGLA